MTRYYEMTVEISGFDLAKRAKIETAAEQEWPFEDWFHAHGNISASGRDSLCGGESEDELTERLSRAIWRANGKYCPVVVTAAYLENLPCEIHALDEDDYQRLMEASPAPERGGID